MAEPTFVERIADVIQTHANAKQVYGDPVERDGAVFIPVARVQWGFGGGGLGHGAAERGGGGGGVKATPAGYIEIRNGVSEFRPIPDASAAAGIAVAAAVGLAVGIIVGRFVR
jgi:uncharacterized spore protein YtfJ